MYIFITHDYNISSHEKMVSDPIELKLNLIVSQNIGDGNEILVL